MCIYIYIYERAIITRSPPLQTLDPIIGTTGTPPPFPGAPLPECCLSAQGFLTFCLSLWLLRFKGYKGSLGDVFSEFAVSRIFKVYPIWEVPKQVSMAELGYLRTALEMLSTVQAMGLHSTS